MSQQRPDNRMVAPQADGAADASGYGAGALVGRPGTPYIVALHNYQYTPYNEEIAGGPIHAELVGRDRLLGSFVERLTQANGGGSFLVNGYRGVGKTSFVNAAVEKLEKHYREPPQPPRAINERLPRNKPHYEPVVIRINLARTLSPDVLMARLVRQIYSELSTPNHTLYGMKWRWAWPPASSRSLFDLLDPDTRAFLELAVLRTGAQVSDTETNATERSTKSKPPEITVPGLPVAVPLGLPGERTTTRRTERSRSIQFLSYNSDAAEDDLLELMARLGEFRDLQTRIARQLGIAGLRMIFIFDEIDKLEQLSRDLGGSAPTAFTEVVGLLKNVFTTSRAFFIFIAGRETHRQWQRDSAGGEGILESVFGQEFYLPCLWEDLAARYISLIRRGDSSTLSDADARRLVELKKYLKFKGRGIARKLNREFYDLLDFRDGSVRLPAPDSNDDADRAFWQRVAGYAQLYDQLNDVIYRRIYVPDFGEGGTQPQAGAALDIETILDRQNNDAFEEQRLGVYYLADRLIELEVFRRDELAALLNQFSENIRPPREEVLQAMLDGLVTRQFFRERTFLIDNEPMLTYAPGAALDHLKGRRITATARYHTQPNAALAPRSQTARLNPPITAPRNPTLTQPADSTTFGDLAVEAQAALTAFLEAKEDNLDDERLLSINGWAALPGIGVIESLRQHPRIVDRLADLALLDQADDNLFAGSPDPGAGLTDSVDPTAGPPSGDSLPRIATILTLCTAIANQLGEGYFEPLLLAVAQARADLAAIPPDKEAEPLMLRRIRRDVTQRLLSSLTRYSDILTVPGNHPQPSVLLVNLDGPRELRVHVPYFARWFGQIAANPRGNEVKPVVILTNPAHLPPGLFGQSGRLEYFPTLPYDTNRPAEAEADEHAALAAIDPHLDVALPRWLVWVAARAKARNDAARLRRLRVLLTLEGLAAPEYGRLATALLASTRMRRWFAELAIYRYFDYQTLTSIAERADAWRQARETPDIVLTTLLRYPQLVQTAPPSGYRILPPLRRALLARPDDRDTVTRRDHHLRAKEDYADRMGLPTDATAHDLRRTYNLNETDLDPYWRVEWAYHTIQSEVNGDIRGAARALLDLVDFLSEFALITAATRREVDALLDILEEATENLSNDEELDFEIRTRRAEWYLLSYEAVPEEGDAAARTEAHRLLGRARKLLQGLLADAPARRDTWPRFLRYIEARIKLARVLAAEGDPVAARDSLLAVLEQADLWDATAATENILLRLAQIAADLRDWTGVVAYTTRYQQVAEPEEGLGPTAGEATEIDYLQGVAELQRSASAPDPATATESANAAESAFLSSLARLDAARAAPDPAAPTEQAARDLRQQRTAAALLLRYLALVRLDLLRVAAGLPHPDAPTDPEAARRLWLDDARLRYAQAVPQSEGITDASFTARLFAEQTRLAYTEATFGTHTAPGAATKLLALANETERLLGGRKSLQAELDWPALYTGVRTLVQAAYTPLG